jgi:hypothetical protein
MFLSSRICQWEYIKFYSIVHFYLFLWNMIIFIVIILSGVRLSPLGTEATTGLL